MRTTNAAIRNAAHEADVHHWEVAEALGISEGAFCRRMRHELPEAEQARILEIINDISAQREARFHACLHEESC